MITPRFKLSQDANKVSISIRAPYCKLDELDVIIEENIFIFACKPYYLRLVLPGHIVEDPTKSSFDADTGKFIFTYSKENPGENFEDLDLITKLLCPKVLVNEGGREIEVLTSEGGAESKCGQDTELKFGFAMRGNYKFSYVSSEFGEVFEIDPYEVCLEKRRTLRLQKEDEKFSVDHYISDMVEDEEIQELIGLKPPWKDCKERELEFTEEELDFLKDLVNVNYDLSPLQVTYCHNGLLEILYGYCYDRRTTYFEGTCGSGWTISKLCAGLSWFDGFTSTKEALISSFRRSLIYPLYRNFDLSQTIFEDVKQLLQLGEQYIIKCLIEIYSIFLNGEQYILNNLFIKDYIVYIMHWDKKLWKETVASLNSITIKKDDLGFDLTSIESVNLSETDLCHKMTNLRVNNKSDILDSDDCSEETTDSSDNER